MQFLQWLEFADVQIVDEETTTFNEEDIRIKCSKGLLIIEVKGLHGTSTDDDCRQIDKIKHRREKERQAFDVYGLYIVNHQKHLPPIIRDNPPFKEQQINDAVIEERGLLTTWQLFNVFFSIESGVISKKDTRETLTQFGLVSFKPKNYSDIWKTKECIERRNGNTIWIVLVIL